MIYEIIHSNDRKSLEKKVNEKIKFDFEPIGGICISNGEYYYQAMINEDL